MARLLAVQPGVISGAVDLRELVVPTAATAARHCVWCGRRLPDGARVGRRRRYGAQSCRQRAYEQRNAVQRAGLPTDAVVLSADEVANLADRLFQLRCAAEDIDTAVHDDDASRDEVARLAIDLATLARGLERLR